jgi:hypothetical protein
MKIWDSANRPKDKNMKFIQAGRPQIFLLFCHHGGTTYEAQDMPAKGQTTSLNMSTKGEHQPACQFQIYKHI